MRGQSGRSAPARAAAAQCTLTPAVVLYTKCACHAHQPKHTRCLYTGALYTGDCGAVTEVRARVQFVYVEGTFYIMHAYMFNLYYAQGESIVHNIKSRLSFCCVAQITCAQEYVLFLFLLHILLSIHVTHITILCYSTNSIHF